MQEGGEAEGERKNPQADSSLSSESNTELHEGFNPKSQEIMIWAEIQNWLFNQLSYPSAPPSSLFNLSR